jgi:hypothetical protein
MRSSLASPVLSVAQLYGLLKTNIFIQMPFTKDMIDVDPDFYSLVNQSIPMYDCQGRLIGTCMLDIAVNTIANWPEDMRSDWLKLPNKVAGMYIYHKYNKFSNWYAVSETAALKELKDN